MVNHIRADNDVSNEQQYDDVFAALASPIRRSVVQRLSRGPATVSELAELSGISLPGMSRHVRILREAGLLVQVKEGRERRCYLAAEPLEVAVAWLAGYRQFWEHQLDALSAYLADESDM